MLLLYLGLYNNLPKDMNWFKIAWMYRMLELADDV